MSVSRNPSGSSSSSKCAERDSERDSDKKGVHVEQSEEQLKELQRIKKDERFHKRRQSIFTNKPPDMPFMKWELLRAVETNDVAAAKRMILRVPTVNFRDEFGMTPLMHVCYNGSTELVQLLLKYNANYCEKHEVDGYTCLHFAVLSANVEICRIFLDAGLDPLIANTNNRTASELAVVSKNFSCAELINYYVTLDLVKIVLAEAAETGPVFDMTEASDLQKLFSQVNLDPVRVAMSVCEFGWFTKLPALYHILKCMCLNEMTNKKHAINEVRAFRFFYMSWTISKMLDCWLTHVAQLNFVELPEDLQMHNFLDNFLKAVLGEKEGDKKAFLKSGFCEFQEKYPYSSNFWFCQIYHDILKSRKYPAQVALRMATIGSYIRKAYTFCKTCDNFNPKEKCPKCHAQLYCDSRCMAHYSYIHDKTCKEPSVNRRKAKRAPRRHSRDSSSDYTHNPQKNGQKNDSVSIPVSSAVDQEDKKEEKLLDLEDDKGWPALPFKHSSAQNPMLSNGQPKRELSQPLSQWTVNSLDC